MEIAIIVALFLIGTVSGAIQAMKYLERRQRHRSGQPQREPSRRPADEP